MKNYSSNVDKDQNIGELIFETLLNYRVDTIVELNLSINQSWFMHPGTHEERTGNIDHFTEFISRQTHLQIIDLSWNELSSNATLTLLTKIADIIDSTKLNNLDLY